MTHLQYAKDNVKLGLSISISCLVLLMFISLSLDYKIIEENDLASNFITFGCLSTLPFLFTLIRYYYLRYRTIKEDKHTEILMHIAEVKHDISILRTFIDNQPDKDQ